MNQPLPKVVDFEGHRSAELAAKQIVPVLSEDHVALKFVDGNIDVVRFDWNAKCWYVWSGTGWKHDTTAVAFARARALIRAMATDQSAGDRRRLGTHKFAVGVETFARADPRVA